MTILNEITVQELERIENEEDKVRYSYRERLRYLGRI